MRKFLLIFSLTLVGCATLPRHGRSGVYTRALPGIELTVVNNYADCIDIEVNDGQHISCLALGHSEIIGINHEPGGPEQVIVVAKGRIKGSTYIGMASYKRNIRGNKTFADIWTIDNLRPPRRIRTGR
ncbi:hypothetical protein KW796_02375 [Candidatus Parcubacteria bacterium]|nr:hypothetical protein [Candidatus Parcubacteria bacterium]